MPLRDQARIGRLEALAELRDKLATAIEDCKSNRDLASLSARLLEVLAQIEQLNPPAVKETPLDQLANRRRSAS